MASLDLQRLWKLAQIDRQIVEMQRRAASLDVGQKIKAQIAALQEEDKEIGGRSRALQQEILDLELSQKSDDDKKKKVNREIYGGKVVNPREVANLEKEIAIVQRKQDSDAERLLELYDLLPPAKKAADELAAKIQERKDALAKQMKSAMDQKKELEAEYKIAAAKRPEAVKIVSPTLLAKYESIRKNHHGIGMVEVDRKTSNCGGCGTHLPERTLTMLQEEKVVTCESCHRILYYTEGYLR